MDVTAASDSRHEDRILKALLQPPEHTGPDTPSMGGDLNVVSVQTNDTLKKIQEWSKLHRNAG
jgi:hypothetical protein